jgi:transposase
MPIALKLTAGNILLADRAYDFDALRRILSARGAWANVGPMPQRHNIPAFSSLLYRNRNLVERFVNKLKHFMAVATVTTNVPKTTSRSPNSPQHESGCNLMRR